jgi:D-amino peptidase
MEGTSQIADHRECWPAFREYWASGRPKLTSDVVAAARGLLDGGASEVVVMDAHGLGWSNVLLDGLPAGAAPPDHHTWSEGFDAMFQVGFHARGGSRGFVSHTMVPGLGVAVDSVPATESHIWAWLMGVPLIGVVGDSVLGEQLGGSLASTPFLAVKHSSSRSHTIPVHQSEAESADAIRSFARSCAAAEPGAPPALPPRFQVEFTLDPELAKYVERRDGLEPTGPGTFVLDASDWARDAQPALQDAMGAALQPLLRAYGDLDLPDEISLQEADPRSLDRLQRYFTDWVHQAAVSDR